MKRILITSIIVLNFNIVYSAHKRITGNVFSLNPSIGIATFNKKANYQLGWTYKFYKQSFLIGNSFVYSNANLRDPENNNKVGNYNQVNIDFLGYYSFKKLMNLRRSSFDFLLGIGLGFGYEFTSNVKKEVQAMQEISLYENTFTDKFFGFTNFNGRINVDIIRSIGLFLEDKFYINFNSSKQFSNFVNFGISFNF